MIDPINYYDSNSFRNELSNIFDVSCYVAHTLDFKSPNSYLSYLLGDTPYTVRNMGGKFYNIENRCLHRLNLIDPVGLGNRDFICNYHGWSYKNNGELDVAPLSSESCLKNKILNSQELVDHDGLLFKSTEYNPSLELIDDLDFLNCGFYHRESLRHNANWKLLVENVLENYHISFVHPKSFVPTGITSSSKFKTIYKSSGSMFEILNDAEGKINYKHVHIFPNLFISITGGLVGFMSYFLPVSQNETVLNWGLFETDRMFELNPSVRQYIKKSSVEFTRAVLNEDKEVLETSQIGIRGSKISYQLQSNEERLKHFHDVYMESMNK